MKKIFLISIISVSFSFSQSLLGVRYPTGISYPLSTTSARMSGSGVAMKEPYLVSSLNPGNLGTIKQSAYSLSANINYTRIYEKTEYVEFSRFSPAFIGFAFPMGKAGTIGASFKQSGSNSYSYEGTSSLLNPTNPKDSIMQTNKFENDIAFSAWEFGWGIELFKKISIGAVYQIGQYKNRFCRSDVLNDAKAYSGVDSIYYNQVNSTIRAGILGQFGKLGIGVSATYSFISDLNSSRTVMRLTQTSAGYSLSQIHNSASFNTTYQMYIPPSGIIGACWTFSEKLKTTADFSMTYWKEYWTDAPLLADSDNILQNIFTVSSGVEFIPQPNLLSSRYFQKVRYSGGFAVRQLPIEGDYEASISLGMGLPLGNRGMLDFSVETGIRRSDLEQKENFVRINFGMSGGQQWKRSSNNIY